MGLFNELECADSEKVYLFYIKFQGKIVDFCNNYLKSVFGWENLIRISNTSIEILIFSKFCVWIKKLKLWGWKKMNAKRREDMVGVFPKRKILMR